GVRVEVRGIADQRLVVVAHQAPARVAADEIDAELGIGTVTDDVAEADEVGQAAPADVGEDRLQRLAIRVQVRDDRQLQRVRPPPGTAAPRRSSAAATMRARTSASVPAIVAPAALTWPPPPKRRARWLTS